MLEWTRTIIYRLALPPNLSGVYDVFHVSQLKKCISDPDMVIETNRPDFRPDLTVPERLVRILDTAEKTLRRKTIPVAKVLWSGQMEREAIWETEESMRRRYPKLFA